MHGVSIAILFGLWLAPVATATAPKSSPEARAAVAAAAGKALQGDVRQALTVLRRVPTTQFGGREAAFRACVLRRFALDGDRSLLANLPLLTARALGIYRAYWRAALLSPTLREEEEERLRLNLIRLLDAPPQSSLNDIEPLLTRRLGEDGYHALTGRTAPLRELMLWKTQTTEQRRVSLPEGDHLTTVHLLADFASFGWSGFATCERSATGGWVRPDAIYAVTPRYRSLEGEDFLVSFVAHESQHYADLQRFPGMAAWELEYRAKLTELVLADTTNRALLAAFAANCSDRQDVPHSYANGRVLEALRSRLELQPSGELGRVPTPDVQAAALAELRTDSARRTPAPPSR